MIIKIFISVIVLIITSITSWLPTVEELPWGLDDLWQTSVASFKAFIEVFPPLQIVFSAFLIYLGFRLTLILIKIFVGSRVPHHD